MKTLSDTRPKAAVVILFLGWAAAQLATAADLRVPSAEHPTIQAAVDVAQADDTIHIAAGVYTEQVRIISKSLTLIGQPGAILRATEQLPEVPETGLTEPHSPMLYVRLSDVTVRGLTFEGERLAERFAGSGELRGILLRNGNATVEKCAFYGFRESTPGDENATAIVATSTAVGEVNLRVASCTFADNYAAILFLGSANRKSMNVTVENNTIAGPGTLDTGWNQTGIQIGEGVGGRITGNTISGFSYVGSGVDFPVSYGIVAAHQANSPAFGIVERLEIEGNTLRDNQIHIALTKADGSVVRNNRFQGTAPGMLPMGLAVSGTNVTIAHNQFEGIPEGIRLLGNDPIPGFGLEDALGFAINAQVTDNRFCEVTTPVNLQAPASATQTGTLLCPFPPPVLDIAPAVLLTWSRFEEDYSVDTAPVLDGPWSPYEAEILVQDGRHSLTVPANSENRFFRLRKP